MSPHAQFERGTNLFGTQPFDFWGYLHTSVKHSSRSCTQNQTAADTLSLVFHNFRIFGHPNPAAMCAICAIWSLRIVHPPKLIKPLHNTVLKGRVPIWCKCRFDSDKCTHTPWITWCRGNKLNSIHISDYQEQEENLMMCTCALGSGNGTA